MTSLSLLAGTTVGRILQRYAGYVDMSVFTIVFTSNKVDLKSLFLEQYACICFIIFKILYARTNHKEIFAT